MANEWITAEVGSLADSISDTHSFNKDRLIFLNTSDILQGKILHHNYSSVAGFPGQAKKSICKGDILFSEIRPANGRYAFVNDDADDYVVSTKLMVIRARNQVCPKYLFHFLTSKQTTGWLQHLAESRSGTFPQITFDQVASLDLKLPPMNIQETIAKFFDEIDDKIELNRKTNETLEAMARAIFKSWFIDFDPVHAKSKGRQPDGMDAETAKLFPSSFQDSSLGVIPKGWTVAKMADVAERIAMGPFGSSIKVSTFVPQGVPVISGQHLWGLSLEDNHYNFVTCDHAEKLKNANVYRGDVIFTHAGSIGQVAYIPETSEYKRYVISQRQFYMRCNTRLVSPLFIVRYFKTHEGQHRLLANTSSTGVPSISRPVSYLRTIEFVLPQKELVDTFTRMIQPLEKQAIGLAHESKMLEMIRDSLLPRLLSGEITVPVRVNQSESMARGEA